MHVHAPFPCLRMHRWRSENNIWKLVLPSTVDGWTRTQVVRLSQRVFSPLIYSSRAFHNLYSVFQGLELHHSEKEADII